jgi:hypothetical protein
MSKLIILSIVILSVALPMTMATRSRPQATLRQVVLLMIFGIFVWSQLCLKIYPQYVPLK